MYHFILNPASRSGMAEKIWSDAIEPVLTERNTKYQVHYSQSVGDIVSLVEEIERTETEISQVIIMGGDGALNEAIQGIHDFEKIHLGLLPIGSSNDFTRDMPGYTTNTRQNLEKLLAVKTPTAMDFGTLTYEDGSTRRFLVSCGIGFDAAVCEEANRSKLKQYLNHLKLGKLVYLGVALKQILGAKLTTATLFLNGQEPREIKQLRFIACMNHKHEGGGFMFAPDADYTDGILDLCEVGNIATGKILFALPTAFKGKHYKYKEITAHKAYSFTVKTAEPQWVHTDGEVSRQSSEIHVECNTGMLQFLRF